MVKNEYGIENVNFAVAPATELIEAVYKLLKEKLTIISVVNAFTGIAFNLAAYRKVIESRAQMLLELKDLNPAESLQLAETFKTEFDIDDDISEAKVERLVLAAAEFYEQVDPLILSAKDVFQGDSSLSYKIRGAGDVGKEAAYLIAWAIDVVDELGDIIELKNHTPVKGIGIDEPEQVHFATDDRLRRHHSVKN